jgi:hypothetical protein
MGGVPFNDRSLVFAIRRGHLIGRVAKRSMQIDVHKVRFSSPGNCPTPVRRMTIFFPALETKFKALSSSPQNSPRRKPHRCW